MSRAGELAADDIGLGGWCWFHGVDEEGWICTVWVGGTIFAFREPFGMTAAIPVGQLRGRSGNGL